MNVVVLEGPVVDDPFRRETSNGVVVSFRMAVDGVPSLRTDVEVWGALAGAAPDGFEPQFHAAVNGVVEGVAGTTAASPGCKPHASTLASISLKRPGTVAPSGKFADLAAEILIQPATPSVAKPWATWYSGFR